MTAQKPSSLMQTYARSDLAFERGEGSYLYTADGRRYLDFAAGIAVNALGHCHPHVVAVINGLVSRAALLGEPIKYIADRGISDRRRTLVEIERSAPATDLIGRQQRQNQQLTLLQLEFFLRNGHDALVNYTKALLAFRRAHEILFASVTVRKSLGERDQEIYDLLKKDLPPLLQ